MGAGGRAACGRLELRTANGCLAVFLVLLPPCPHQRAPCLPRVRTCLSLSCSQLGPMGKVWESGAVQVVQCADSLSSEMHPCNRLPGAEGGGQHAAGAVLRDAGVAAAQAHPCNWLLTSLLLPAPLSWLDCGAGEMSRRIAECIYVPLYDRTGTGVWVGERRELSTPAARPAVGCISPCSVPCMLACPNTASPTRLPSTPPPRSHLARRRRRCLPACLPVLQ